MNTGTRDTLSNTRNIKSAMVRLEDLEKANLMLMSLVDREIGTLVTQVNALSEVINALTDVVGADKVQAILSGKAQEKLAQEQAQLDQAFADGKIAITDKVTANSIVGYEEKDASGQLRIPGKFFKNVSTLSAEARQLLDGKGVGFEAGIGNGATMKVTDIWDIVPPKPVEAPSAETTPAAE